MAVVHTAWDDSLGRPVAVKVLAAHLAGDPEFRARFLREARIASRLQHPNLVRVFDIAEIDGLPAIVMELVDGPTLAGGRLTLEEAAQVADGVAHAHAHGVVHRDLKPGNLLRGRDGVVKIGDFGIARAATETKVTQIGTVLGTLRYLAPEQADGREVGPAADVYSLGVVFDELLERKPRDVTRILERARADDPRKRPAADDVAATLRGEPPTTTATAVTRVLVRRRVARRYWPALAMALLLAAVAVGLAIGSASPSKPARTAPPRIPPVPHSADAARQARNLSVWLQRYSK
jgi:serine/threonine protein kinase